LIEYAYDNLSRLREARYNPGVNIDTGDGDLLRRYKYSFDRAGNRRTEEVWVNGSPTADITYDYNGANQLIDDGTHTYEYDGNGNLRYKKLTGTPVETYTWNRANRLVTWDNGTPADLLNYSYDGLNNRISRSLGTTSPTVTKYLLDLQPGLSVVLAAAEDTDVTRYVHGPMGIHAHEDPAGAWSWMVQDGLGSVRSVVDNSVAVDEVRQYGQFGDPITDAPYDYAATVYGFTGELTETVNPLVHLRARDYNPALGVFTALDVLETPNRYTYTSQNPINKTDPTGLYDWDTYTVEQYDSISCIAVEGGVPLSLYAEFERQVVELNKLSDPNYIQIGQLLFVPDFVWANGEGVFVINAVGKSGRYQSPCSLQRQTAHIPINATITTPPAVMPGMETCSSEPGPLVLTGGFRTFEGELSFNLGHAVIALDLQFEWRCSPYYAQCGWFVNFGIVCGGQFGERFSRITPNYGWAVGAELGLEYWPTCEGQVSIFNSTGGSIPYWRIANLATDVTWDPTTGAFVWQVGGSRPGVPSLNISEAGASVYVGYSLDYPGDLEYILNAIRLGVGLCYQGE
jgi:RHS repeat-associated protein